DAGDSGADSAGPGRAGDGDGPLRLRQDQSLSDLTGEQLAELTTAVQSRTDRELSAFYDDVQAHLDDARDQGVVTSRRNERDFLRRELTPAYATVYNPRTGEFYPQASAWRGVRGMPALCVYY
ncbi:MAG: hypothetical protein LBU50_06430, partial [Cellulomonas sp.]|nr:hypothetical protein [Cellulomonas sp.]